MQTNDFANFTIASYTQYVQSPFFEEKMGKNTQQLKYDIQYCINLVSDYINQKDAIFETLSDDSIRALTERIITYHKIQDDQKIDLEPFLNKMFVKMNSCIQLQNTVNTERLKKNTFLNDENIEFFIQELYIPMMGEDAFGQDGELCISDIRRTKPASLFISEFSINDMLDYFKRYGVIQLREFNKNAKTLIIGCGHDLVNLNFFPDIAHLQSKIDDNKEHKHVGEVTVDIDLMRNPDILANFGTVRLSPIFRRHRFERIIFEGFVPDKTQEVCQDMLKLLKSNGQILLTGDSEEDLTSEFQEISSL